MSGWSHGGAWTPRLAVGAVASAVMGLTALVAWLDAASITRSPFCGPACLDQPVTDALGAPPEAFASLYPAAREAIGAQLSQAPFDTGAWLRLAMLELRAHDGRLSPEATEALRLSYERAPVDATMAQWRIPLMFNVWPQISFELRQAASREVTALYGAPETQNQLRRLLNRIVTPEGRFVYQLQIQALDEAFYFDDGRDTPKPIPSPKVQTPAIAGS